MEHGGAELARPFVEAAHAQFPTVADENGVTSQLLNFKAVPNGVFVDPDGVVRYAKYGGFSVERPEDVAAVEHFLRGEDPGLSPEREPPYQLGPIERELVETKLRLGHLLVKAGQRDEGVEQWRGALRVDPENLVIRKQIWSTLYPEKFHPTIDWDWQRTQLSQEREAEVAAGVCGPDGCPLPWS